MLGGLSKEAQFYAHRPKLSSGRGTHIAIKPSLRALSRQSPLAIKSSTEDCLATRNDTFLKRPALAVQLRFLPLLQ